MGRGSRVRPLLAITLLAGCGGLVGGTPDVGPLGDGGDVTVETCSPRRPGQAATFAVHVHNPTPEPLTLNRVSFAQTDGVTLLGAVISPEDVEVVAAGSGYPPQSVPDDVWAQTRPLEGAVLGREAEYISIGLRLDGRRGVARTVLLDYEADGEQYRFEADHTFVMRRRC